MSTFQFPSSRLHGLDGVEIFGDEAPFLYQKVNGELPTAVRTTSHKNLVNIKEIHHSGTEAFLLYDEWGISLWNIATSFQLGEVEVSAICKQVLKGLEYVHNVLGIYHGLIDPMNIVITKKGGVKIANIGNSMMQKPDPQGMSRDIQAVRRLARDLLHIRDDIPCQNFSSHLAKIFTDVDQGDSLEYILKHPFLQISSGGRCLRTLRKVYLVKELATGGNVTVDSILCSLLK